MDWADELALKIWQTPGVSKIFRDRIAKEFRDVRRETAEECACICEAQANRDDDCEFSTTVCHNMDAAKIRERFPKEKP